jgi:hypothetical protein
MISIQLKGPQNLQSLTLLPEALKNQLFKGMQDGALLIEQTSKTKYLSGPYPNKLGVDSGMLRQGVWAEARQGAVGTTAQTINEFGRIVAHSQQWYGKVHEQKGPGGIPLTTPFTIFPKTVMGMTFFWKRRNVWVRRAELVNIPARPFLYPAVLDNLERIRILLNKMIRQAYKQVGGKGNP